MIYIHILFISLAFSNNFNVKEKLDKSNALIGDVLIWSVKVEGDSIEQVRYPLIDYESDSIMIKNQGFFKEKDIVTGTFFELIAWDKGTYLTPNYQVNIIKRDSTKNINIELKENLIIYITNKESRISTFNSIEIQKDLNKFSKTIQNS